MDTDFTLFGLSKYFETLSPFCCSSYDVEGFQGARPEWVCDMPKRCQCVCVNESFSDWKNDEFWCFNLMLVL